VVDFVGDHGGGEEAYCAIGRGEALVMILCLLIL